MKYLEKLYKTEGMHMKYRIEYANGKRCDFAHGRKDLLERLKRLRDEEIADIRKLFKNGYSETVMDIYEKYIT